MVRFNTDKKCFSWVNPDMGRQHLKQQMYKKIVSNFQKIKNKI